MNSEYIPYKGSEGPPYEQAVINTKVFLQALKSKGLKAEMIPVPDYLGDFDSDTEIIKLKDHWAFYDRWGFVIGNFEDSQQGIVFLSEFSFEEAMAVFERLYVNGKSV